MANAHDAGQLDDLKRQIGDQVGSLIGLFQQFEKEHPGNALASLIPHPGVQQVLQFMRKQTETAENTIFCKCPHCEHLFEVEMKRSSR